MPIICKFNISPILIAIILSCTPFAVVYFFRESWFNHCLELMILLSFWPLEYRVRAHKITLMNAGILKRAYFGLGTLMSHAFDELEGFYLAEHSGWYGETEVFYEYLYIFRDGKKIISISEFYHQNYEQLKKEIEGKLPYLGEIEIDIWDEIIGRG